MNQSTASFHLRRNLSVEPAVAYGDQGDVEFGDHGTGIVPLGGVVGTTGRVVVVTIDDIEVVVLWPALETGHIWSRAETTVWLNPGAVHLESVQLRTIFFWSTALQKP